MGPGVAFHARIFVSGLCVVASEWQLFRFHLFGPQRRANHVALRIDANTHERVKHRMKWLLPIGLLITFEFLADIFAKQWSLDRKAYLAAIALLGYLVANSFWLFALKNGSG